MTTSQLFVGSTFFEERCDEEEGFIEEFYEQEPQDLIYCNIKKVFEKIGVKCIDIQFGDHERLNGTRCITSILCERPADDKRLETLLLNAFLFSLVFTTD